MSEQMASLPIPLGVDQLHRPVVVDMVESAGHWIIQGQIRSGKSFTTYNVLATLAGNPCVRVVGVDPSALILAPWAETESLISLGQTTEQAEQIIEILEWVNDEGNARTAGLFARRIDKLTQFTPDEPLILLVLEEFAGMLEFLKRVDTLEGRKPAERYETQAASLVSAIIAQHAKAGVRLVLLTQRAEASIVGGTARSNMAVRMTLRHDNGDAIRMLHENITPDELEQVSRFAPGVAFFESPRHPRELMRNHSNGGFASYSEHVLHHEWAKHRRLLEQYPHLFEAVEEVEEEHIEEGGDHAS